MDTDTPTKDAITSVTFNRSQPASAGAIDQPSDAEVKATPSLWQADLDTALMYGGDLTRAALGAMNLRGDKTHIVVDTKVHMLMPGQCPAIPGWHTDGAPRTIGDPASKSFGDVIYSPLGSGPPDLRVQHEWDAEGRAPRFHLLVTGEGCLTEFLTLPYEWKHLDPTADLYAQITRNVERLREHFREAHPDDLASAFQFAPSCTAVEWDWWNLHQGVLATKREWRFLIRVTESDYHQPLPRARLAEIIRTQSMVYTPAEFGW